MPERDADYAAHAEAVRGTFWWRTPASVLVPPPGSVMNSTLDDFVAVLRDASITSTSLKPSGLVLQLESSSLWIDSPWRLEKDGEILLGTGNLEEYRSHEDYAMNLEEAEQEIQDAIVGRIVAVDFLDFQDLRLDFDNGIRLRCFQDYGPDAENFQLTTEGGRFLVYPDFVQFEPSASKPS